MSKATIYLPDELYKAVKANGIPISETCQRALAAEVALRDTPEEGLEIMGGLYKWLREGRRYLSQLEDFLA
jgi:Post-segregation antitoxin CcdA